MKRHLHTGRERRVDARSGNVTVLFAMAVAPMTLMLGMTADVSRVYAERSAVLAALDAAGLAAAKSLETDGDALTAMVDEYLSATLAPSRYEQVKGLSVESLDGRVVLDADVTVATTFAAVLGAEALSAPVRSEIVRQATKMEVALVLDNTGSMNGSGKIGALREAAEDLVDGLYAAQNADEFVKVSIVPYVTAVNVRGDGFDWSWVDTNAQSTHHGVNFDPPANHLTLFDDMGVEWKGCVEMRASPYDVTDAAPNPAIPNTLWTPYFWPDEPKDGGGGADFDNDYIYNDEDYCDGCEDLSGEELYIAQQADTAKYQAGSVDRIDDVPSTTYGPNKSCAQPIVPLTNNKIRLIDEIRAMKAWNNSGTNGAAGLAWGWRVLSPTPPYTQGVSYADSSTTKAVVMMTDGENVIYGGWDSPNKSNYSSYGYLSQQRLGTDNQHTAKGRINDKILEVCEAMKDDGIKIFTVTFKLNSSALKEVYRSCASEPEYYFDSTSNAALVTHFQSIAGELSQLRIAR